MTAYVLYFHFDYFAATPQAGADGCPEGEHEAPQLSLSVGQISAVDENGIEA